MKPTTLLTLLATATAGTSAAATRPLPLAPTRPRDAAAQHPHRLLHTLTPAAPSTANFRVLAAATESTKGGAVLTLPNSKLSTIHATLRVPEAKIPTAGPTANNPVGVYAASFWVGADAVVTGACAGGGALRAGVDIFYDGTLGGVQRPFVWYQGPGQGSETGFAGFEVAAGDLVRFKLEVGSEEGGEVVVVAENFGGNVTCVKDNGAVPVSSVRQVLPASVGGKTLCRGEAAWVVEDFPLEGLPDFPVALANFTSVAFGAGVTLEDGSERDLAGAEVLDVRLEAQGGRLTSCEVVDGKKVKCARVVGDS
ncbi:concanavalin A-like lectin/glucanase domain-containing protein [Parachaetomium inaequale]|uniref:Concanavalin A-like lectin/glucanase domain-containing protein n=1 Tax=Parachaetomium inaequale TaxID=2588326 RepID=A0AAN6SSP3_9PEZI|nr:concanavalin A-like lectin/glucanase domain-containing protein [Parachaetomium inaequale]